VNQACNYAINENPHDFIHLAFFNSSDVDAKIADLYKNGNSFRDIAKVVELSKTKVRDILIRLRIPIRSSLQESRRATQVKVGKKNIKPPYGFVYLEGRVVKHPKEYPVLLQIISLWKKGRPLNSIATYLNVKRIPSPMGKSWSWNSIDNIIKRIKNGHLVQTGDGYELR
jgi:transposase-like protein